jgi:hypothetical protein
MDSEDFASKKLVQADLFTFVREVTRSNIGWDTDNSDRNFWWLSSVLIDKCQDNVLNQTTRSCYEFSIMRQVDATVIELRKAR